MVRLKGGEGGNVMRLEGGEGRRVVRLQGGEFLVLFKGGECRVTPRFHTFISDVNHSNEKAGWIQDFLV